MSPRGVLEGDHHSSCFEKCYDGHAKHASMDPVGFNLFSGARGADFENFAEIPIVDYRR